MISIFKGDTVTAVRSPIVYIKKTAGENWWHSIVLALEIYWPNSWFSSLSVFKFVTVTAPARADAATSNKHSTAQPWFFWIWQD